MDDHGIHDIKVACFRIGRDLYAVDIMRIREIIKPLKIAAIPRAPAFVEGILNLRGEVIPVVDLRKRFDMPQGGNGQSRRLLIVALSGQSLGVIVDEVTDVINVLVENIKPPPRVSDGVGAEYLIGVCLVEEDMVWLLNPDRLLTKHEVNELKEMDEMEESPVEAAMI
jgi:purine-binding chemotaxis protein CheW